MFRECLSSKRRARPFTVTSYQLPRDNFTLQLLIYPFSFFCFQPVRRSPAGRACRNGVMKEVPQGCPGFTFFPKGTSFSIENLPARFHVSFGQAWTDLAFGETEILYHRLTIFFNPPEI